MSGFAVLPLVAVLSIAGEAPTPSPLRPQSIRLQYAVDLGLRASETFRILFDALAAHRAIVLIVARPCDFGRREACLLHQVVTAGGYRFLRVNVRDDPPYVRLAALIAHELQHALEATQAGLTDADSFERFFAAHGYICEEAHVQRCYETAQSLVMQARVVKELSREDARRR